MGPRRFDSSVLIAHLRGVSQATPLIRKAIANNAAIASVLSRVELESGMRSQERDAVRRLLSSLTLVAVSDDIARAAGRHLRSLRASHQGVDVVDFVIAATGEEVGAELVTLNVKHFPMFEGLQPAFVEP